MFMYLTYTLCLESDKHYALYMHNSSASNKIGDEHYVRFGSSYTYDPFRNSLFNWNWKFFTKSIVNKTKK